MTLFTTEAHRSRLESHVRFRFGRGLAIVLGIYALSIGPVMAIGWTPIPPISQDGSLKVFAVNIDRTPKQSWPGYGIYLGNGYVLTAAHVVGRSILTQPRVEVDGKLISAEVVREGDFEEDDLTLLRVDQSKLPLNLRMRRLSLCKELPQIGSSVVIVTPEGTARSRLISPKNLSADLLARFPTLIADVASTGNSGSGVFDPNSQCLLGIMSRKISNITYEKDNGINTKKVHDIAKYFVPSAIILRAIPPGVVF